MNGFANRSHRKAFASSGQGGKLEIGAPTGKWQMIVVYRGKHCPVSKNYLASLQQIIYELDELGVEVVAVSGDGRERAEAFVSCTSAELLAGQLRTGHVLMFEELYVLLSKSFMHTGFMGCPGT
jgi:peroxiredoxin